MTGYDYPPFAAVLLRPLAFLSARWQDLLWLWISLGALVGGAVITARALLPATWPRARAGIFVALTFPAATYNLWHGQMNTLIFLLLAMALSDYLSGHRTRCGMILGLAAGIKIAPIVLLVVLVRRGWWRGALAGVATGAATVAIGIGALGWSVTSHYLSAVLPVLNRDNGWIYNQTWNGVVNRLAQHSVLTVDSPSVLLHGLATVLSVVTVGALLVAVRSHERTRAERGAEFACGVIVMLLVGSIAWYPVYVHLLIAIAAAVGLAHERGRLGRGLVGWSAAALVGVGAVGGAAIAAIGAAGVNSPGSGPSVVAVPAGVLAARCARGRSAGRPGRRAAIARGPAGCQSRCARAVTRSASRRASRSAIAWRLSQSFLPLPRANSSLMRLPLR